MNILTKNVLLIEYPDGNNLMVLLLVLLLLLTLEALDSEEAVFILDIFAGPVVLPGPDGPYVNCNFLLLLPDLF
jgi:hypothetical protein